MSIPLTTRKMLYAIAKGDTLRRIATDFLTSVPKVQEASRLYKVPHNCGMLDEEVDERIAEFIVNPPPPKPGKPNPLKQSDPAPVVILEPDPEVQDQLAIIREAAQEASALQARVRGIIHDGLFSKLEQVMKELPEVKDWGDVDKLVKMVSANIGIASKGQGGGVSEGLDLGVLNMRPIRKVGPGG